MKLSVGSKVFLMGEYLAISGGPALLASFDPRFQLSIKKKSDTQFTSSDTQLINIDNQSPAGIFYYQNYDFFSQYQIEFFDPHFGRGGWGASSAQYAMLAAFYFGQATITSDAQWNLDLQQVDKNYLKITLSQKANGLPPSGMDVIAQLRGGLVQIDRHRGRIENVIWPFNDISFLVFATGVKVPTHTHLDSLTDLPIDELNDRMSEFKEAFLKLDQVALVDSISGFRNTLIKNNLELPNTTEWISKLKTWNGVLTAKGCGAMGADVILLIIEKNQEQGIVNTLREVGVKSVVTKDQLTGPIQVSFSNTAHHFQSEVFCNDL